MSSSRQSAATAHRGVRERGCLSGVEDHRALDAAERLAHGTVAFRAALRRGASHCIEVHALPHHREPGARSAQAVAQCRPRCRGLSIEVSTTLVSRTLVSATLVSWTLPSRDASLEGPPSKTALLVSSPPQWTSRATAPSEARRMTERFRMSICRARSSCREKQANDGHQTGRSDGFSGHSVDRTQRCEASARVLSTRV